MPLDGLVTAMRERAVPHDKNWFAYKTSEEEPQAFLAERLGRELGLPFEPADIALTAGAFAAIMVAFRLVLDAGDEAVFSEPAWFCYEPMLLAADAVPRKVALKASTFDLDLAAIERRSAEDPARDRQHAAQSDRPDLRPRDAAGACRAAGTRVGPHRPAHLPAVGRALSAPALRRPRFRQPGGGLSVDVDLLQLRQGAARAGPATWLSRDLAADAGGRAQALRDVMFSAQMALGWCFPNAVMQYAVPDLERLSIDRGGARPAARSADATLAKAAMRSCRRRARSICGSNGPRAIPSATGTRWPTGTSSSCRAAS